jgi:hypothetical protein
MIDISKGRYKFKYLPRLAVWCKKLKCCWINSNKHFIQYYKFFGFISSV